MQHSAARNFGIRMDNRNTWKKFEQRFEMSNLLLKWVYCKIIFGQTIARSKL